MRRAEEFERRFRSSAALRLLKLYLDCDEESFALVAKRVRDASDPENTYAPSENALVRWLGLIALPYFLALHRRWLWTPEPRRDYNLETIDRAYFDRFFADIYRGLRGSKRLTPRSREGFAEFETTEPLNASVHWTRLLALAVLTPLMLPCLAWLSLRCGRDLATAYRHALTVFAAWDAYFQRYPCRDFVTFDDENNHPVRHIAFRRRSSGRFITVQNGERILHPHWAYGSTDHYFMFGEHYIAQMKALRSRVGRYEAVGSLGLNEQHALIEAERTRVLPVEYDVLMIDQGIFPYNGASESFGRALDKLRGNLNELKRRRPKIRVAYQLRRYAVASVNDAVLAALKRVFTEDVRLIPGDEPGRSYRSMLRAELTLTFESTMGFEALRLGRKALFANYSGDPAETLCPDPRFQLVDEAADYGLFERKVDELLAFRLDEIPAAAIARHHAFDGKVQQRISAAIEREAAA